MAITRINDPPFIFRTQEDTWEKFDAGKKSYGLYKGYNTDSITAAQLGLKTIHGAMITKLTVDKVLAVQGSVILRGSKSNSLQMFISSAATAYGTFAHFYVDAWGY